MGIGFKRKFGEFDMGHTAHLPHRDRGLHVPAAMWSEAGRACPHLIRCESRTAALR
jgi:hypothetical protein